MLLYAISSIMIFAGAFLQQSPYGFWGDVRMNYALALALAFGYVFRSWRHRAWFAANAFFAFFFAFGFAIDEFIFAAALIAAFFIFDLNFLKREALFVAAIIVSTCLLYNSTLIALGAIAIREMFYTAVAATFFVIFLQELEQSDFFSRHASFLGYRSKA